MFNGSRNPVKGFVPEKWPGEVVRVRESGGCIENKELAG